MDRLRLLLMGPGPVEDASVQALQSLGYDLERCPGSVEAFAEISRFRPDLLMLDCGSWFTGGMQFCRMLRAIPETSRIPLVVLAMGAEGEQLVVALEAGADDCLTQPVSSHESILRIRALNRRVTHAASPRLLHYEQIKLDVENYKVWRNQLLIQMPLMQFRLLQYLMEHPTIVFSRQQLLEAVWANRTLDEGAVTACMVRLRRALNATGGPNLIRNVPGRGYSLDVLDGAHSHPAPA